MWSWAATSVSGPMVNRPDSPSDSSSTAATNCGWGEQGEAVLGERRGRPELAPGLDGVAGAIAQPQQPGPVARRAPVVDHPHQAVEVGAVDQLVERVVCAHPRALDQRP